jgi:hypothetical protein
VRDVGIWGTPVPGTFWRQMFAAAVLAEGLGRCRDQMERSSDAGVPEIGLVCSEPYRNSDLRALRAVAPKG